MDVELEGSEEGCVIVVVGRVDKDFGRGSELDIVDGSADEGTIDGEVGEIIGGEDSKMVDKGCVGVSDGRTVVRDVSLKKRDSGTFLRHLSFWVSGMKLLLIFLYTKKEKKKY